MTLKFVGRSVAKSSRRRYEKRPQWTQQIISQLLVSSQQKSACQDRAQLGGVLPKRTDSETERGFWERWRPAGEWVVVRQPAGGTPALPGSRRMAALQRTRTKPIYFAAVVQFWWGVPASPRWRAKAAAARQ
jgi:hypothetical protein